MAKNTSVSSHKGRIPTKCHCGLPIAQNTSWTPSNPGRKFKACPSYDANTEMRGCKTFYWVDEDIVEWQTVVTNKLLMEKKALVDEVKQLRRTIFKLEEEKKRGIASIPAAMKKRSSHTRVSMTHLVASVLISIFISIVLIKLNM